MSVDVGAIRLASVVQALTSVSSCVKQGGVRLRTVSFRSPEGGQTVTKSNMSCDRCQVMWSIHVTRSMHACMHACVAIVHMMWSRHAMRSIRVMRSCDSIDAYDVMQSCDSNDAYDVIDACIWCDRCWNNDNNSFWTCCVFLFKSY